MREFSHTFSLRKSDKEGKFYGVVLEPNLPDAHGDVFAPVEIEKAAHLFMSEYAASRDAHDADVQHAGRSAGAELIENFCAPCDLMLGGHPVRKGSWVQGWQINDPLVKQEVEEEKITGLSLEGTGVRRPIEREI
jgi:hypothetical protein